jgi:uncharacterized oligopeptide transporter (OPT) family protein
VGGVLLVIVITLMPALHMNLLGAILIVLFGFLFVTVSSRLTGEIGSSSNPISGMTVATLLLTSLFFLALGWVGPEDRIAALSVAAIVCVAASNGGTTAQDLKTGYLVGGTPKAQQVAILFGAFTSAVVIGYTLNVLNEASTVFSKQSLPIEITVDVSKLSQKQKVSDPVYADDKNSYNVLWVTESAPVPGVTVGKYLVDDSGKIQYRVDPGINGILDKRDDGQKVQKYEAPKARLMSLIIDGILTQKLPWGLVLLGVAIAIVLELCKIPALPFAVGVYLPMSASMPIFLGGVVRWAVSKVAARRNAGKNKSEEV